MNKIVQQFLEVLSSEDKWTKGAFARDINDHSIPAVSQEAVKWCLTGALSKIYTEANGIEVSDFYNRITKIVGIPEKWNDEHSYKEVIELVKKIGNDT